MSSSERGPKSFHKGIQERPGREGTRKKRGGVGRVLSKTSRVRL